MWWTVIIALVLSLLGIWSVATILDALKLVIVMAITPMLLDLYYRYLVYVFEEVDKRIVVALVIGLTALTDLVIYQSWGAITALLIIAGILYVIYYAIVKRPKLFLEFARGKGGKSGK